MVQTGQMDRFCAEYDPHLQLSEGLGEGVETPLDRERGVNEGRSTPL